MLFSFKELLKETCPDMTCKNSLDAGNKLLENLFSWGETGQREEEEEEGFCTGSARAACSLSFRRTWLQV